eukprot:EG_transcript_2581
MSEAGEEADPSTAAIVLDIAEQGSVQCDAAAMAGSAVQPPCPSTKGSHESPPCSLPSPSAPTTTTPTAPNAPALDQEALRERFGGPPRMVLETLRQSHILALLAAIYAVILTGVVVRSVTDVVYWDCQDFCIAERKCTPLEYDAWLPASTCASLAPGNAAEIRWGVAVPGFPFLHRFVVPALLLVPASPAAPPAAVALAQRVTLQDGTVRMTAANHTLHCTPKGCDPVLLAAIDNVRFVRRIEVAAAADGAEWDVTQSQASLLLPSLTYTILTLVVRYMLMMLTVVVGVLYFCRWRAPRPRPLMPEQYGLWAMLPLVVVALNPLLLPSMLLYTAPSTAFWAATVYLEQHWGVNFTRLMCAGVWAALLGIARRRSSSPAQRWPVLIVPAMWWLATLGLDIAVILLRGVAAETPYSVTACQQDGVLCAVYSTQVAVTSLVVFSGLASFFVARHSCKSQPYLRSRSRRLALLFLSQILLCYFVSCLLVVLTAFFPSFEDPDKAHLLMASSVTYWLSGQSLTAVVTLAMALAYAPLPPSPASRCPPPYDRGWVAVPWRPEWLYGLRANGGCAMYFFFSEKERLAHLEAQRSRGPEDAVAVELPLHAAPGRHCCHFRHRLPFRSEHLFCLETCLSLFNLSWQVYNRPPRQHRLGGSTVLTAMAGVGRAPPPNAREELDLSLVTWELVACLRRCHNQAIVVTAPGAVAVAFRGTVNRENVRVDLQLRHKESELGQLLEARYPLHEPFCCFLGSAYVHAGFLGAYQTLQTGVTQAVSHALEERLAADGHLPVLHVTGHSLGGAVASLCAYDLATTFKAKRLDVPVRCYTFGAPRVGNAQFAMAYNLSVPETYRVCNESDIVCHSPPALSWLGGHYQHAGRRVLIDEQGNLLVDPLVAERIFTPIKGKYAQAHLRKA